MLTDTPPAEPEAPASAHWARHGSGVGYQRQSRFGVVRVLLLRAAGGARIWTAVVTKRGFRLATGRDAAECMANADAQITRLTQPAEGRA